MIDEKKVSRAYLNQAISAIKFYYGQVLKKPRFVGETPRPRSEKKLPVVLSRSEVVHIFGAIDNAKHRALLMTFPPKVYAFRRMREGVHGKKPKKGRNAVGCVVEGLLEGRNGRYRRENENNRRLRGPAAPFGPPVSAGSGTPRP